MFLSVSRVLSGISLFVFGLNFISENAAKAAVGEKATKFLRSAVKRPAGGLFAGVILSAIGVGCEYDSGVARRRKNDKFF